MAWSSGVIANVLIPCPSGNPYHLVPKSHVKMKNRTLELKKIWAQHDEQRAFMPLYATQQMIDKRLAAILCPGPSYYYILNFANFKFDFLSRMRTIIRRQGLSEDIFPELYGEK